MQMVWHDTNGNGFNAPFGDHGPVSVTQKVNAIHQHRRTPIRQRHREKKCHRRERNCADMTMPQSYPVMAVALRSEARQGICSSNRGGGSASAEITGTRRASAPVCFVTERALLRDPCEIAG